MNSASIQFEKERASQVCAYSQDESFQIESKKWLEMSMRRRYVYNFDWLGRPIIQYPQDIVAVQELIWATRPDLIIETGIAHGGSLLLSASMLALLDYCDASQSGTLLDTADQRRKVVGIDIDIRPHNRAAIEAHPLHKKIEMFEGSSVSPPVISRVCDYAKNFDRVMVMLDSNHTHDHVLAELEAYAGLTGVGCYCVVFDSFVEDMPADLFPDRPWGPGNNPQTAIGAFLERHNEFVVDADIPLKLQISVAPDGFLKRVA